MHPDCTDVAAAWTDGGFHWEIEPLHPFAEFGIDLCQMKVCRLLAVRPAFVHFWLCFWR